MNPEPQSQDRWNLPAVPLLDDNAILFEAEQTLKGLAEVFFQGRVAVLDPRQVTRSDPQTTPRVLNVEERYRALVEQIPAVVFMAYLDKGIGEAYVSPQIEAALGFSQSEWLEDPMRWYRQIHPDDKQRWSMEAAEMFLSGQPLKSAYRVLARDGRVLWPIELKNKPGHLLMPGVLIGTLGYILVPVTQEDLFSGCFAVTSKSKVENPAATDIARR